MYIYILYMYIYPVTLIQRGCFDTVQHGLIVSMVQLDSIAASLFVLIWLSWQIVSDDKIQITILILRRGALSRPNTLLGTHIWASQIWSNGVSLKRSCKMQFRHIDLVSKGPRPPLPKSFLPKNKLRIRGALRRVEKLRNLVLKDSLPLNFVKNGKISLYISSTTERFSPWNSIHCVVPPGQEADHSGGRCSN